MAPKPPSPATAIFIPGFKPPPPTEGRSSRLVRRGPRIEPDDRSPPVRRSETRTEPPKYIMGEYTVMPALGMIHGQKNQMDSAKVRELFGVRSGRKKDVHMPNISSSIHFTPSHAFYGETKTNSESHTAVGRHPPCPYHRGFCKCSSHPPPHTESSRHRLERHHPADFGWYIMRHALRASDGLIQRENAWNISRDVL